MCDERKKKVAENLKKNSRIPCTASKNRVVGM
jgi:ribosomal protein L39E